MEGVRVCVAPAEADAAVKMSTLVNEQTVLEQSIVPDAAQRPITESGCRGWQWAEWSRNGQRLFTRAELACGDQPMRTVSGLSLMTVGPTWLDIQVVKIGDDETVQVRRYRHAGDQAGAALTPEVLERTFSAARRLGDVPLALEDVKEASGKVSPKVVEAALAEAKSRVTLNSRALIDLANAGVSASVIDVMVALSFPEHFTIERNSPGSFSSSSSSWSSWSTTSGIIGLPAWYGSSIYSGYDPYGYYSPFNYSYWGYYRPLYYFTPMTPSTSGRLQGATQTDHGRAVDGRGYTRVRPRQDGSQATPRDEGSRQGSSGGSTGSASPGGYSSGGSSGSTGSGQSSGGTGRTAVAK